MAWYKTDWFDLIGTDAFKENINSEAIKVGDIDCSGVNPYIKLSIKLAVVFGSVISGNVSMEVYGLDADLSNKPDTEPIWTQYLDDYASSERVITVANLDVSALDSIRVIIRNNGTANSINAWVSYHAVYIA